MTTSNFNRLNKINSYYLNTYAWVDIRWLSIYLIYLCYLVRRKYGHRVNLLTKKSILFKNFSLFSNYNGLWWFIKTTH